MYISKRAAIEASSFGVGVSTSARKWWREYYAKQGVDSMSGMRNKDLNDVIASDFLKGELTHKFKLKSGEIAVIKKSHSFYYIAKVRSGGGGWDIIVIQSVIKTPSEKVRKLRVEDKGWGGALV